MIDLLYLSWNRCEFTEASLKALRENTDWSLVRRLFINDDGSVDGSPQTCVDFARDLRSATDRTIRTTRIGEHLGSPVAVMNSFLSDERFGEDIICKLDNDVIVPPGWLNAAASIMENNPMIDLLGIEPGVGPDPDITEARPPGYPCPRVPFFCDFIGGIGLMRRRIFDGRYGLPEPNGQRYGFTEWQERHPQIKKAWIAPGLPVVLLNRMPTEPWARLSREYVAKGWQREWPGPYREDERSTWEWFDK